MLIDLSSHPLRTDAVDEATDGTPGETPDQGFTLIELLVVITILGILAAITVFSVQGIGDKGQASACKTDSGTIRTAEEAYFAKNSTYATLTQLAASPNAFLATPSTLHDVTVTGTGSTATYSIVVPAAGAKCFAGTGSFAANTAVDGTNYL